MNDCKQTPLEDHIRYAIERMQQGARMTLDAIPNDSSLSSASFGPDVTAEIARRLRRSPSPDVAVEALRRAMIDDVLVERLRYRADNYTAYYSTSDRDLDKLILAEIYRARAAIALLSLSNGER